MALDICKNSRRSASRAGPPTTLGPDWKHPLLKETYRKPSPRRYCGVPAKRRLSASFPAEEPLPAWVGWPTAGPPSDRLLLLMRQAQAQGHVDWVDWYESRCSMEWQAEALRGPRSVSPRRRQWPAQGSCPFTRLYSTLASQDDSLRAMPRGRSQPLPASYVTRGMPERQGSLMCEPPSSWPDAPRCPPRPELCAEAGPSTVGFVPWTPPAIALSNPAPLQGRVVAPSVTQVAEATPALTVEAPQQAPAAVESAEPAPAGLGMRQQEPAVVDSSQQAPAVLSALASQTRSATESKSSVQGLTGEVSTVSTAAASQEIQADEGLLRLQTALRAAQSFSKASQAETTRLLADLQASRAALQSSAPAFSAPLGPSSFVVQFPPDALTAAMQDLEAKLACMKECTLEACKILEGSAQVNETPSFAAVIA
mmetsp:Transcript_38679/g.70428  ORF Transcript_38679/g.70428 Transcript_38679/m.70428 type:complete len:425 (+) Transcript_38679:54-1328(+)